MIYDVKLLDDIFYIQENNNIIYVERKLLLKKRNTKIKREGKGFFDNYVFIVLHTMDDAQRSY